MCTITAGARRRLERESFYVSYSLVMDLALSLSLSYSCSGGAEMVSDKYLCWNAGTCYHHAAAATLLLLHTKRFLFLFPPSLLTDDGCKCYNACVFCACCSAAPAGERPPQRDGARQTQAEAHLPLRRQPAAPHRVVQARSADRALQEVQNCNKKVSNHAPVLFYLDLICSPHFQYLPEHGDNEYGDCYATGSPCVCWGCINCKSEGSQ
jgi:hypothetical protein